MNEVKMPRAFQVTEYMDWIKRRAPHPSENMEWGLALSGMPDADANLFDDVLTDLPIYGDNHNGWRPWKEALAEKFGLQYEQVSTSFGTQQSNFLAIAALAGPGDRVIVEYPTYEPLVALPRGFACQVEFLRMRRENDWKISLEEFTKAVGKHVRLVILANSHNPTGVYYTDEEILQFADVVKSAGGHLLVDEVYRDAVPALRGKTAARLTENIVVTSSWTKVYGIGPLRAGWMFGAPDVIEAAEQVHDRLAGRGVMMQEALCARIARAPGLLEKCGPERLQRIPINRKALEEVAKRNQWDVVLPDWALTVFPAHPEFDGDEVSDRAQKHGVLVTPGRFFGDKNRVRITLTADTKTFARLLTKLEEALK